MIIQFNTDKTVSGKERGSTYFTELIEKDLERFSSHVTRVEVHLSDENGKKEGNKDIRCLMEARIEGHQPIVVTSQENNVEKSVSEALVKLKASLKTIIGKASNH
jgi:ribosome-associated translation inhibitor RaiA